MEWIRIIKDQHFPDQASTPAELAQEARRRGAQAIVFRTRKIIEEPHVTSPVGFKLVTIPMLLVSAGTEGSPRGNRIMYVSAYRDETENEQVDLRRALTISREIARMQLLLPGMEIRLENGTLEELQDLANQARNQQITPLPPFQS